MTAAPPTVGIDVRRAHLWPETGIARYIRNLMRHLEREPPVGLRIRPLDVTESHAFRNPIRVGRGSRPLTRALQEQVVMARATSRLDVVHLPWTEGPAFPRCPLVLTLFDLAMLDGAERYDRAFRAYYGPLAHSHIRRAARIIVSSTATLEAASRRWPRAQFRLIPLGVDPVFCDGGEGSRAAQPTVLYTGGWDARKRIDDLSEAVARVAQRIPEVRLVATGRPPDRVRALLEARLGQRVCFPGYLDDSALADWYKKAWVVAYPTDLEGFGFPIAEAFATGTPVVGTDAGSVRETMAGSGLLVPVGDLGALTEALAAVLSDGELRLQLRTAGLRTAASYDWAHVASQTADVYRELTT